MADPRRDKSDERGMAWIVGLIVLFFILLVVGVTVTLLFIFGIRSHFQRIGEGVTNSGGAGGVGSLTNCRSIPAEWRPHFDQAGTASGAPPALIAAIFAAGEHRFYQSDNWPRYVENPPYPSDLNPERHDYSPREGWVRGPAQFKENSFQAYSPEAKRDGRPSRFGTGFRVEPYIELMQPSLNAAGAYLFANGGRPGASEVSIKRAIRAYNHADWYVDLVYPAYLEYLRCSTPGGFIPYTGSKACPVGQGDAGWGNVRRSNPHVPTYYPGHEGLDIFGPRGTPIYAVVGGRVMRAGYSGGYRVFIDDGQGHYWFYQHMQPNLLVRAGQTVVTGQQIGYMSNTGAEGTNVHLHLGIAKTAHASTHGDQLRWDLWYYPYDLLHDIPCLARTLRD